MGNRLGIAFFGASLIGTALVVACSGAPAPDVLGQPSPNESSTSSGASGAGTTSGASGTPGTTSGIPGTTSGTPGTTSSTTSTSSTTGGPDCLCAQPPAGCVANPLTPGKCDCSYRCPDAGGPVTCTFSKDDDPCPDGYYCNAPSCGVGSCVAKGREETKERNPQCGCDGVTYWNPNVAAKAGMAIKGPGACALDSAVRCGGLVPAACKAGVSCNRNVKNKQACSVLDSPSTCWKMPEGCPGTTKARACGVSGACLDECKAIINQSQWYEDPSCN